MSKVLPFIGAYTEEEIEAYLKKSIQKDTVIEPHKCKPCLFHLVSRYHKTCAFHFPPHDIAVCFELLIPISETILIVNSVIQGTQRLRSAAASSASTPSVEMPSEKTSATAYPEIKYALLSI